MSLEDVPTPARPRIPSPARNDPAPNRIAGRRRPLAILIGALLLCMPAFAVAQLPAPPEITVQDHGRDIVLTLSAENSSMDPGGAVGETRVYEAMDTGPFVSSWNNRFVGDGGAMAQGQVSQKSNVGTFRIDGEGEIEIAFGGGAEDAVGSAEGQSNIALLFTVGADGPFDLHGTLEADASDFSVLGQAFVTISGTAPDGTNFYHNESISSQFSNDPLDFFHTASAKANTPITLQVQAGAIGSSLQVASGTASASFDFSVDFGDRDGDGLLNVWEQDGIDIDDDDVADIDLPAMDADPDRKNLYVEVDAISGAWQGATDQAAVNDVVGAFAQAPGNLVENPDGSDGVILHVQVDDTNLPAGPLTGLTDVLSLKQDWFGDPADHADPDWQDLKDARERVFRYCVWADSLLDGNSLPTGEGERPGNDFIVAAGRVRDVCPYAPVDALAGTFMHELGHNLGLRHGGEDGLPYKPNYMSVMSYVYQVPYANAQNAWYLDYSAKALMPLYEHELDENAGLDGLPYRKVLFNSAADGSPTVRTVADADAVPLDWNQDGDFGEVDQNISSVNAAQPDSADQFLISVTDWDRLWYHLSGHSTFEDGVVPDDEDLPVELTVSDIQDIGSSPVIDLTATSAATDPPRLERGLRARPNPFNPQVEVSFALAGARTVSVTVYNLRGERVRTLIDEDALERGPHRVTWDGSDDRGRQQASGVYLVELRAGAQSALTKVTLIK